MQIVKPVIAFAVLVGAVRALTRRKEPGDEDTKGELRYQVPVGQDAAAVMGQLRTAGYSATAQLVSGEEDVVIACDPVRDRERVRDVLRDAPVDMAGHPFDGPPITFADE